MIHSFEIDWLGRPHLANAERRAHYHTSAKLRAKWSEASVQACQITGTPKGLDRIGIHIQPIYATLPLPDPDAAYPTAKAIIDGLVAYGVVADDNGAHVAYVALMAPILERGSATRVRVTLIERPSSEG